MSGRSLLAVLLIALGVATFLYQGVAYATRGRAPELAIGEHTHVLTVLPERSHELPVPPLFGVLAYVGGIALLTLKPRSHAMASRRRQVLHPVGWAPTPRHAAGRSGKFHV